MTTLTTILATNAGMEGLAVMIGLCGVALRYWLSRRSFNRRNGAGRESFKSYEHMRAVVLLERIGRVSGTLMIIIAIFVFLLIYITSGTPHHR